MKKSGNSFYIKDLQNQAEKAKRSGDVDGWIKCLEQINTKEPCAAAAELAAALTERSKRLANAGNVQASQADLERARALFSTTGSQHQQPALPNRKYDWPYFTNWVWVFLIVHFINFLLAISLPNVLLSAGWKYYQTDRELFLFNLIFNLLTDFIIFYFQYRLLRKKIKDAWLIIPISILINLLGMLTLFALRIPLASSVTAGRIVNFSLAFLLTAIKFTVFIFLVKKKNDPARIWIPLVIAAIFTASNILVSFTSTPFIAYIARITATISQVSTFLQLIVVVLVITFTLGLLGALFTATAMTLMFYLVPDLETPGQRQWRPAHLQTGCGSVWLWFALILNPLGCFILLFLYLTSSLLNGQVNLPPWYWIAFAYESATFFFFGLTLWERRKWAFWGVFAIYLLSMGSSIVFLIGQRDDILIRSLIGIAAGLVVFFFLIYAIWKDLNRLPLPSESFNRLSQVEISDAEYYLQQNEPGRAAEIYITLIQKKPNDPDLHIRLAGTFELQKRWPEAVSEWEAAVRLDPDNIASHFCLGAAYENASIFLWAKDEYNRVLEKYPQHPEALAGLARLKGK